MDCPVCQGDNRKGARFCRHCGATMVEGVPPEPAASASDSLGETDESTPREVVGQPEALLPPAGPQIETEVAPAHSAQEPVEGSLHGASASGTDLTPPAAETLHQVYEAAEAAKPEIGFPAALDAGATDAEIGVGDLDAHVPDPLPLEAPQQPADSGEGESLPESSVEGVEEAASERQAEPLFASADKPSPAGLDEALSAVLDDAWSPLAPGTVVGDRYLVVDHLEASEGLALYQARDLWRCWQCGFEDNDPDNRYCAQCGATLDRRPGVRLLEAPVDQEPAELEEPVLDRLDVDGRRFFVLAEAEAAPDDTGVPAARDLRLVVGLSTDAGRVRELNEDSLLAFTLLPAFESRAEPLLGLYAVADGMGGHEGGEVASKLALQVLGEEVLRSVVMPELQGRMTPEEELALRLGEALASANDALFLARQKRDNDMGTTLTAALVRGGHWVLAHVGDSRAYLWGKAGLEQLTTDHSLVARMVAAGQIEPDEIYTHPHRSVIYRSIGDRPLVDIDTHVYRLDPGDRFVVCSDGLWEMIRTEGIEDVMMQEADPQEACDMLVKRANLAGGEDNISVIVVLVEAV